MLFLRSCLLPEDQLLCIREIPHPQNIHKSTTSKIVEVYGRFVDAHVLYDRLTLESAIVHVSQYKYVFMTRFPNAPIKHFSFHAYWTWRGTKHVVVLVLKIFLLSSLRSPGFPTPGISKPESSSITSLLVRWGFQHVFATLRSCGSLKLGKLHACTKRALIRTRASNVPVWTSERTGVFEVCVYFKIAYICASGWPSIRLEGVCTQN